jgi:hypothetical protein
MLPLRPEQTHDSSWFSRACFGFSVGRLLPICCRWTRSSAAILDFLLGLCVLGVGRAAGERIAVVPGLERYPPVLHRAASLR